ncbi:MAG: tripeptide aminopeptidase [Candidatus Cloacimonadota bacterium]|nr:tripeptide aminopeptidase [Candidatus Cloacimonadota bacterium]
MQSDVISYFMRLIAIDSESLNERAMIDALKLDLLDLGAQVDEDECYKKTGGNAGNLYAYLPGTLDKDPILLCAHVDTVTPGKGIKARIEGNKIVTNGTTILGSDDKSGIAEIMIALNRIKESGIAHAPIEVLFTVSEEIGLLGAKCFDKSRIKSAFGYALDCHRVGELLTGAPSQKSFEIVIRGVEAHAGVEPEKGLNAIKIAAEAISAMPMGRIDFETTCNVGKIRGGESTNIVPSEVTIYAEARSHSTVKLQQLCSDIEHAFTSTVSRYEAQGAKLEFKCELEYDSINIPQDHPVVKLAQTALRNLDIPFTTGRGGGGSDANVISASGVPMIITGTGMNNVHTVHENIEIDQLFQGTDFIEEMIKLHSSTEL